MKKMNSKNIVNKSYKSSMNSSNDSNGNSISFSFVSNESTNKGTLKKHNKSIYI